MSVELLIKCDGRPGGAGTKCFSSVGAAFPWHNTATKIRRFGWRQGWHRTRDGRDICPKCWAENVHKGAVSPDWCAECEERRPCGCDDGDWMPLPGEDEDAYGPGAEAFPSPPG